MASNSPMKYPKTPHLPFSPGVLDDDEVLTTSALMKLPVLNEEVVVTEKLDGGNCCLYQGKVYARTTSSEASHPSFGPVKQLLAQVSFMIPDNIQIFGENMFGIHSIEYDRLESYFYIFSILEDGSSWLTWDKVKELSEMLGMPTVPEVARKQFSSSDELRLFIEGKMKQPSECGTCNPEGFVIRTLSGFPYNALDKNVIKYVRKGHIQTSDDWRQTWKQAKLSRK